MAGIVFAVDFVGSLGSFPGFYVDIPYFAASRDAPAAGAGMGRVGMRPHFPAGISSQFPT